MTATHASEIPPKPAIDLPAGTAKEATAIFAGGCFWCTEAVFRQIKGVKSVTSGYSGDTKEKANYEAVCAHITKHAEAIKFVYDPAQISYGQLLQIFFVAHDPTTLDRQGADRGHQYRSAIFFQSPEEKKVAEAYIKQLDAAKYFPAPIVTTLEPLTEFYPAEDYHQNFVALNPNQGYVRQCSLPKVQKIREVFSEWLKK
ncbi:MAG: peptide-methionine (S)-S-oxide reductase MsrA [Planctomycetota bacterium]